MSEEAKMHINIICVLLFMIIGSVLIGKGTNGYIGTGVFFIVWAIAGLFERLEKKCGRR